MNFVHQGRQRWALWRRADSFILLYALAWTGGSIAYTPLLTVLLPARIEAIAGQQMGVTWLAYVVLAGALAASIGGIFFGYLSDITGNRRGWIFAGLMLSSALLLVISRVDDFSMLILLIFAWQLALNMMLGPLAALAADIIPNQKKGVLGGLMAFAPALGALSGALVTQPSVPGDAARLGLVAAAVLACVLPILIVRMPPAAFTELGSDLTGPDLVVGRHVAVRMWLARLLVQLAEATLFAYLLLWLIGLDPSFTDHDAARLFTAIMFVSAPLALAAGRWSDRTKHPIAPLRYCASIAAFGLIAMTLAPNPWIGIAAYAVFGVACAIFLALHSSQTLRILPNPNRRGRDLGLFNLANTTPSLIMPWLVMAIVPHFGFPALYLLLAVLAAGAALLLKGVAA